MAKTFPENMLSCFLPCRFSVPCKVTLTHLSLAHPFPRQFLPPRPPSFWDPELLCLVEESELAGAGVLGRGLGGVSPHKQKNWTSPKLCWFLPCKVQGKKYPAPRKHYIHNQYGSLHDFHVIHCPSRNCTWKAYCFGCNGWGRPLHRKILGECISASLRKTQWGPGHYMKKSSATSFYAMISVGV